VNPPGSRDVWNASTRCISQYCGFVNRKTVQTDPYFRYDTGPRFLENLVALSGSPSFQLFCTPFQPTSATFLAIMSTGSNSPLLKYFEGNLEGEKEEFTIASSKSTSKRSSLIPEHYSQVNRQILIPTCTFSPILAGSLDSCPPQRHQLITAMEEGVPRSVDALGSLPTSSHSQLRWT
jgi:hypothetical protein